MISQKKKGLRDCLYGKFFSETKEWKSSKGQSLIEYLLLVSLIGLATVTVVRTLGKSLQVQFARVAKELGADVRGHQLRSPQIPKSGQNVGSGFSGLKEDEIER